MGSGTTLVEAKLLGRNAVGVDINPQSVSISETNTRYERTDDKIMKEGIAYDQQITTVFSNDSYQTRGIS